MAENAGHTKCSERVVLIAIDGSDNSQSAFKCKFRLWFLGDCHVIINLK